MFDALPEPKTAWFVPQAGHNDVASFGLEAQVLDYLARIPQNRQ